MATNTQVPVQLPALIPAPVQPKQEVQMVQPVPVAVTSTDHTALLINSSFQLATLVVVAVLAEITRRMKNSTERKDADAAEAAKEKARVLAETNRAYEEHRKEEVKKQEETLKIVNTIHTLVNSDMHVALQTAATLAAKIASITGTPEDRAIADAAQQKVIDHDKGQAVVDAGKKSVQVAVERRK